MIHPLINLFQQRAELLDIQNTETTVDDAIWKLAAWMGVAADHLTADDQALLGEIGGILYRDSLRRRIADLGPGPTS